jgi:uridylate kinase
VIFGAGAGLPYFSTDTVSVQRALETHCQEVLMGKNGVDGVYSADPRTDPTARRLDHLTYTEAIVQELGVMDSTALSMCRDNGVRMRVFGLEGAGNVTAVLRGEKIGTLVTED